MRWDTPEGRSVAGPTPLVLLVSLERQESRRAGLGTARGRAHPSRSLLQPWEAALYPFQLVPEKISLPCFSLGSELLNLALQSSQATCVPLIPVLRVSGGGWGWKTSVEAAPELGAEKRRYWKLPVWLSFAAAKWGSGFLLDGPGW